MITMLGILVVILATIAVIAASFHSPVYVILAGIAMLAAVILLHVYLWKTCHYACPYCHSTFKPTFRRSLFAINAGTKRWVTCTHCGKKDYMEVLKDKNAAPRGNA